ncbi:MAG: transglutaminase domain-containing protein [Oleispira sp.]
MKIDCSGNVRLQLIKLLVLFPKNELSNLSLQKKLSIETMDVSKNTGRCDIKGLIKMGSLFLFLISSIGIYFSITPLFHDVHYKYLLKYKISNHSDELTSTSIRAHRPLSHDNNHVRALKKPYSQIPPHSYITSYLLDTGFQRYPDVVNSYLKNSSYTPIPPISIQSPRVLKNKKGISELVQWVLNELDYSGFQKEAVSLKTLLKIKSGDCTEFSLYTYHALAENGFEDVVIAEGLYIKENDSHKISQSNMHSWVLVKAEGQWLVVDSLYGEVKIPNDEYIVLGFRGDQRERSLISLENQNQNKNQLSIELI